MTVMKLIRVEIYQAKEKQKQKNIKAESMEGLGIMMHKCSTMQKIRHQISTGIFMKRIKINQKIHRPPKIITKKLRLPPYFRLSLR